MSSLRRRIQRRPAVLCPQIFRPASGYPSTRIGTSAPDEPHFATAGASIKRKTWKVAVKAWLAHPGPALLDVVTDRAELVMPPHVDAKPVFGMALYSAKAILSGRADDVADLVKTNLRN